MKIGIIAGNRLLPLLLAQRIKQNNSQLQVIAICFKGETDSTIKRYVDKTYWLDVGKLSELKKILQFEGLKQCIMAGQINPLHIFRSKTWDAELKSLVGKVEDFRPHTIFKTIVNSLEAGGVSFLDSTAYLGEDLAENRVMNDLGLKTSITKDIDFGLEVISRFVELDVGQTVVVKKGSVVGLESLEGTDRTIKRAHRLAGSGCVVLKFSKANQDLRFDVPVVGISTLKLLKRIKAEALVLEKEKVIILEKPRFLSLAKKWKIPVLGRVRK
ncbi:MAG: UDP-2,3-diacylglucosamine diphosphatase LpxI [Candidatus Omnitrophica bacterium]|nr:UDP-2,3-diacylglucosamine diphosphatase LpxI [Candidatus Omnitrophota bacterium]